MELKIKEGWGGTLPKLLVSATSIVVCLIASFLMNLGVFLVPFLVVAFVLIFFFEKNNKKVFSIIIPALSLIIEFVCNGIFSATTFMSVIIAVIIYLSLTKDILSKGEAALAATSVISVIIGFLFISAAFYVNGVFDFALAIEYYTELTDNMREIWIKTMDEHIAAYPDTEFSKLMTPELIVSVFDTIVSMVYSMVGIFAFLITGISFKLSSALLSLFLVDKNKLSIWRFSLSRIFGIFYIGLYAFSIFLSGNDTASIVVLNLINIFLFIFAYIGFGFAYSFLKGRIKNGFAAGLILVVGCIFFYSYAIELLSFVGIFASGFLVRMNGEGQSYS